MVCPKCKKEGLLAENQPTTPANVIFSHDECQFWKMTDETTCLGNDKLGCQLREKLSELEKKVSKLNKRVLLDYFS